jgi:hypothetical protein
MEYTLFADESGTTTRDLCYTIGCLLVPKSDVADFERRVSDHIKKHNVPVDRELKWTNLKNNHGVINLIIDMIRLIISSSASYICKVTWKKHYRKWQQNEEAAFYTSYTLLMKFCAKTLNSQIRAKIDEKSDSYDKQHEVVEIIANHKLKGLGRIDSVTKCDSKKERLIQIADLITGAVNASHNIFLSSGHVQIHKGKLLAIRKIAECLGWDYLHYDTFPNGSFNIWHFPFEEFRAQPATKNIRPRLNTPYVLPQDLAA